MGEPADANRHSPRPHQARAPRSSARHYWSAHRTSSDPGPGDAIVNAGDCLGERLPHCGNQRQAGGVIIRRGTSQVPIFPLNGRWSLFRERLLGPCKFMLIKTIGFVASRARDAEARPW